jgi:hypothetical protein
MKVAGQPNLNDVNDAHKRLRDTARAALAADSRKGWGWRHSVPPEAVGAAELLASLPEPFPRSSGPGHSPVQSAWKAWRRGLVWALDGLRRSDGKRLTIRELVVLFMLVAPQAATGPADAAARACWLADGDWCPAGGSTNVSAEALMETTGFSRLFETVRKDRASSPSAEANPPTS